jgi:uncharacterized protein (DUF2062 family)
MFHYLLEAIFNAAILIAPVAIMFLYLLIRYSVQAFLERRRRHRYIMAILHNEQLHFNGLY